MWPYTHFGRFEQTCQKKPFTLITKHEKPNECPIIKSDLSSPPTKWTSRCRPNRNSVCRCCFPAQCFQLRFRIDIDTHTHSEIVIVKMVNRIDNNYTFTLIALVCLAFVLLSVRARQSHKLDTIKLQLSTIQATKRFNQYECVNNNASTLAEQVLELTCYYNIRWEICPASHSKQTEPPVFLA